MSNEKREQQMMAAADAYVEESEEIYNIPEAINDFCAGWRNADRCSQWIPVEERLPEFVYPVGAEVKNTSEYVLAYNGYTMYISRLVGGKIHWWEDNSELVPTHWMPLPVPPRKETSNER